MWAPSATATAAPTTTPWTIHALVELEEDPVEEDEDDDEVHIDIGFMFLGEREGK